MAAVYFQPLASQGTLVVAIGQNFTASTFNVDSLETPADGNGAVGPRHFVEFINGRFSVFNKTNGAPVQTMTDLDFWTSAGLTFGTGIDVSDPRLLYDPSVQRWFAAAIDFNSTRLSSNRFLVAVSTGALPTGTWTGLAFQADPITGNFADFPTLGMDAHGVYLGADMFDSQQNDIGVTLVSIPKTDLLAPAPTLTNRTSFGTMSYSSRGAILQPAVSYEPPVAGEPVLAVSSLGLDFQPHSNLTSFAVLNAAGPGAATLTGPTILSVSPYAVPLNPPQPDGSKTLDDGDARISATVYQVGYVLYAVHCTQVGPRAAVRWYRINATNHAVLESGTLTDTNLHLFYPSIAANTNGTVVIAFNGCSTNTFVSCYAVAGETVGNVTTFGRPLLLKAGVTNYQKLDPQGVSRWGDYSATSVDPSDPRRFWTIQMYPSAPGVWSTQITELITSELRLLATRAGTNLMISWSSAAVGFQLQSIPAFSTTDTWSPVPQPQFTNNGRLSVLVPLTWGESFFRLVKPSL